MLHGVGVYRKVLKCLLIGALFVVIRLHAADSVNASVQFEVTADWGTQFNAQISITNKGSSPIQGWTLAFDFTPDILQIWDATIVSQTGSHYVIQSAGWNSQIAAGGSVVFGFGGAPGGVTQGPQNITVTAAAAATLPPVAPYSVTAQINETAAWDTGFSAIIQLTNTTATAISNWQLQMDCNQTITSILALSWSAQGATYTISNLGSALPAGGSVSIPIQANGQMGEQTFSNCAVNGSPCNIAVTLAQSAPTQPAGDSILIGNLDGASPALQFSIGQTAASFPLRMASQSAASFTVAASNPAVVSAQIGGENALQLTGLGAGRSSLKIQDTISGTVRYVGVSVLNSDGSMPGMPPYLALGSVSDDTSDNLGFWQSFGPGPTNKRADIRYIYLNGGPFTGWTTWTNTPGARASEYIDHSQQLGLIPFFVFYNIPDASEGYAIDLAHVQDASYMQAYFQNLKLALDLINQESPGDLVGLILEPDFIGYLAQNAGQPAASISAMTHAAYSSGVLAAGTDPTFPDTVQGLVGAINYTISKYAPQVYFGWQVNLWASPAGGWTTSIPNNGIIHKTDSLGVTVGRPLIYQEAAAITKYYLDAGVTGYGAKFLSVDKYGLDAVGFQASAAQDPSDSTWFWNNDQWQNYLTFVEAMHDTSQLPIILWQLPVGHINSTLKADPYTASGVFTDLANTVSQYEDSSSTFFFGDQFNNSTAARLAFFSENGGGDPTLSVNGSMITWGSHLSDAAAAGVIGALFGAGVGVSTTNLGNPPTDGYWWITSAQTYYDNPVPLSSVPGGSQSVPASNGNRKQPRRRR